MGVRRVAVVGAGVSGLASVKSCLEEGLEPVCFEQHGDVGGIWYSTEEFRPGQNARIYDSLILNTSKGMVCFSDFPFPDDAPTYPTGQHMHGYLKSYAEKFQLLNHIQLNTKVVSVMRSEDYDQTGSWDVETEVDGKRTKRTFDAVIVSSGFYTTSHIPKIEGFGDFQGSTEHSQTFKSGLKYQNKRILVVGNSNSAGDVAVDISRYAKQVYLSVGKGTLVIHRCQKNGLPLDFMLKRIFTILPLPDTWIGLFASRSANARFDHRKAKLFSEKIPPKGAIMVNDDMQMRIMCGAVKIVGNLARFGENHAEFDDGTRVSDLDGVVFATGLQRKISFLDPFVKANEDKLEFYKMAFPIHLPHDTLAVVGYLRTFGSVVPLSELQSRIAARVFAGKHTLPAKGVMRKDIDRWNRNILKNYGVYKYSFPNVPFKDELAEELGIKPTFFQLLKLGPAVTYQYYFGPAFTVHHRLVGPGAWDGAVRACAKAQHGGYPKQLRKLREQPKGNHLELFIAVAVLVAIFCVFYL